MFHCFAVLCALCGQSILADPGADGSVPVLLRHVTVAVPITPVTVSNQVLVSLFLLTASFSTIVLLDPIDAGALTRGGSHSNLFTLEAAAAAEPEQAV